jgi:hypothetical protein
VRSSPPEPERIRFPEGSGEGVGLVRLIRRWASSDYAFRQRKRFLSAAERKDISRGFRYTDPDIAEALLDFRHPVIAEVRPEKRKAWSPRDPGREKGFSVRNAANAARQLVKMNGSCF